MSGKRVAFHTLLFVATVFGVLIWRFAPELTRSRHVDPAFQLPSGFELASLPLATRFDVPLGKRERRPRLQTPSTFLKTIILATISMASVEKTAIWAIPFTPLPMGGFCSRATVELAGAMSSSCYMRFWKMVSAVLCSPTMDIAISSWSHPATRSIAASKSQRLVLRTAAISPICILKCASSLRHSSGRGIGRKPTAGSTRALSSLRIAARPKMMLTEENRTIRSTAGLFRPNFDSHLVPAYRERASNTRQQQTDKDATFLHA